MYLIKSCNIKFYLAFCFYSEGQNVQNDKIQVCRFGSWKELTTNVKGQRKKRKKKLLQNDYDKLTSF